MSNTPQIRFAGFTDAWEQRKFSELTEIRSASRVHKEEWQSSGVPFYRSSDVMAALNGTENEKAFISEELYEKLSAVSGKLEKGDVLVTGGGSVGKPYIVPNNEPLYTKDADLLWIKNNENLDLYFVYTFFFSPTFTDYLNSVSHVGTIAHYTITQLGETPITLPCVSEQQKIGDYFRNLDSLITLHQRKCDALQKFKKSMLQKMFPQNGESVPEIRFAGFTDAWEQRKVQDVADRFDNLRIPVAANLRVHGTTPYYGANGIQDYVEGFTHDGEFVLVAEDGANDLKNYPVKCVNGRIWVNNHAHVLQGKAGIADNSFLAFAISQSDIESLLVGGGRAKLNAEALMSIEFRLPCLQEQYRIGEYLTQLDNLITLHQRKCDALQKFKKSLLQKMFP